MRHWRTLRGLLGGAGLVGCVGLLAGQARADIVEFVPVRSAKQAVASRVDVPRPADAGRLAKPAVPADAASRGANRPSAGCDGQRIAMAPSRERAPD